MDSYDGDFHIEDYDDNDIYADYIRECIDNSISYSEYLTKCIDNSISYAEDPRRLSNIIKEKKTKLKLFFTKYFY